MLTEFKELSEISQKVLNIFQKNFHALKEDNFFSLFHEKSSSIKNF